MKRSVLNSFVYDRLKSINQNLSDYAKDKNPKCLHKLRVDIKKIKAIGAFVDKVDKAKFNSAKLNQLFKDAGKIREVQINMNLVCNFSIPPKRLIHQLKKKENLLIRDFMKKISSYNESIVTFGEGIYFPHKTVNKKEVVKFFKRMVKKANSLSESEDREDMHSYRMKIKKIMYIYNLLPAKYKKYIVINKSKIDKLQHKIGEWHDVYTALNFTYSENIPKTSIKSILILKDKEQKLYDNLFIGLAKLKLKLEKN